jgi:tetratricopeptide (TPR) repeat protein
MLTENSLKMVLTWLVLINAVFSFIVLSEIKSSDKIEMKIWVDKELYLTREPIFVNYETKNVSDSMLFLNFLEIEEYFVIKDQTGHFYGPLTRGEYIHGDTLLPHQSHSAWLNITDSYRVTEVGEYECYVQMPSGGFFPYTGAKSNTIKIKVKEPKGDERKALDLYLEAENLRWGRDKAGRKDLKKMELGFLKYIELVDKYPKSVYAPLALRSAWGTYHYSRNLEDRKKNIPIYKRLIESYSNSYYFLSAFSGLVDTYAKLKDKSEAIQTMKELIEKHPNTKISEKAEYWLEKIEKWEFK